MQSESALRKRILLLGEERELISGILSALSAGSYEILAEDPGPEVFDLCIAGAESLRAQRERIERWRAAAAHPILAPVLLVGGLGAFERLGGPLQNLVNDIILKPIDPTVLQVRVRALLGARDAFAGLRQRAGAAERIAGSITHDLSNFLTVIAGYGEILSNLIQDETQKRCVRELTEAALSACELARRLPVLAPRGAPDPRPLDLNALIGAAGETWRAAFPGRFELRFQKSADLWLALADPVRVEQELLECVLQASADLPPESVLTISAANYPADAAGQGEVVLRVQAADASGGVPRGKARELRFARAARASGRNAPRENRDARAAGVILLVEDSETVRALVREVLVDTGYLVLEAPDAASALRLAADRKKAGLPLHLLLSDVVIPGLTGPELARRIADVYPEITVLFMSGYMFHAGLPPHTDFLQKPFRPEALAAKIRGMLGGSSRPVRILIVDDDDAVRGLLTTVFERAGYQTGQAENGRKAIAALERQPFDLMITDLIMPEQEGIETIKSARRQYSSLKVLAMSGALGGDFLKVAKMVGADGVLQKPLRIEHVLETVRNLMASPGD